jgi:hypothetical protein
MCGDPDAAQTFSTTVPGSSRIDQLSTGAYQTFCTDVIQYQQRTCLLANGNELTCRLAGLFAAVFASTATSTDADMQALCKPAYDSCIAQTSSAPPACQTQTGCTATVDQLVSCLKDLAPATQQSLPVFPTCAQLTASFVHGFGSDDAGAPSGPARPASCIVIDQLCPQPTPDGG